MKHAGVSRVGSCRWGADRWLAGGIALAVVCGGAMVPAHAAEVRWRSGAVSAPTPMGTAELVRAFGELAARDDETCVVAYFAGPLAPPGREALQASGVRLLSYLGGHAYFARLTPALDPTAAAGAAGLTAIEAIDPSNKLHPDLAAGIAHPWSIVRSGSPGAISSTTVAVYVLFHRDVDLEQRAEAIVRAFDGTLVSRIRAINGVVAHLSLARLADLAAHDDVMFVEPPLPALEDLNAENSVRTGAGILNDPPYGLDGSGVTVMVYDGGRVASHVDLAGRLTVGQSDTSGTSDHATHVACTVGGAGAQFSGMAPGVQIVSYGFEQPGGLQQGFLYTDPGDLEADYTEAISLYGADLSNNSIGTNTASNGYPCEWEGNYGATSALIDEVVRGALGSPFRIVWANGNERSTGACGTSYLTTAPPACAKNSLTVGALNSNDDSVTSFTSWGPCDDGRLKPDVSAPGCQSGGDNGVTSCSSSGGYTVKCGTSMASPTAAGVSALLLEQYRKSFLGRPDFRNSLLRAVLAQTAVDLGNPGPDYQSGYGSIRAVPAANLIAEERFVEDTITQGQVYVFTLEAPGGVDLKVTLAWDDPAASPAANPVLVNDLDLRIVGPDATVYHPWTLNPGNPGAPAIRTVRDGSNNIEQVVVSNAPAGTFTVEIEAVNIAEGPEQPFGLAASLPPMFCQIAPTFAGLTGVQPGDSCGEIRLNWNPGSSNCGPFSQITYNVYRHSSALPLPLPFTLVHQGLSGTSFVDQALPPGATRHYLVRAHDSVSGEDENFVKLSATAPVTPDTAAPIFGGLASAVAAEGCGEIVLDWQPAIETCSGPVTYEVYRSTDPDFAPGPETLVATTFATGLVDAGVTPGAQQTYLVRTKDAQGNAEANEVRHDVTPPLFDIVRFTTGFEATNEAWSVVPPNNAATGNWEWGDPSPTNYQPDDDASNPGTNCWITGLSPSPSNGDVDDGTTTLLSAPYDLSGAVAPVVEYSRWFTNDKGGSPGDLTDVFSVAVSNDDGQNWTPLETVGAGTPLAWVPVAHALPLAPTSAVRFRFTAADLGAGSLVEAAIDEFRLVDSGQACLQCAEPPAQTLCQISVSREGDDVRIDWSTNPVAGRAVVYRITGCGTQDRVKLGTSDGNSFLHESAAASNEFFQYRVTFVDACGNELPFCGTTDCE